MNGNGGDWRRTGLPCPSCRKGSVSWRREEFRRQDNYPDWRLEARCMACGVRIRDEAVMERVRLLNEKEIGEKIYAMQEEALALRIGPGLNAVLERRAAHGKREHNL